MDSRQQRGEYYYSTIPWRHSILRISAFGLDPIILLLLPLTFLALSREWPSWIFVVYLIFGIAIIYAKWRGFPRFIDWIASLRTRAQGVQWPVR